MKMFGRQIYRFEGVEVDPSQGCVKIDGQERYIRQKLLQILIFLIEERHRIVTKEDLSENIWDGAAITDDTLVQSIKEVRKALSDDPRQPRFIKTVPKIGYRFIATVALVELPENRQPSLTENNLSEATPLKEAEPARRSGITSYIKSLSRSRTAIAAAMILIMLAGGTYFVARALRDNRQSTEVILPHLPGKKSVAIMYFDNQSSNADLDWLREGLADMLITDLSRSKRLNVLGRQQLHLLLERIGHKQATSIRLDDALEIGRKTQAETLMLGSFAKLGNTIRVNVQLYDAQSGQALVSESIVAEKPEDIIAQVDLLSLKLSAHLGALPGDQQNRPSLASVITNNLDAYRYYSLALEKAQAYHSNEAIQLWEKATQLDPEFAMAYARIGYTYVSVRVNEETRGKPYLEKALQLPHRLTEKDRLYINAWYAQANSDEENTIRALREVIAQYPQETEAYLRLGYLLQRSQRVEESVDVWRKGLVFDPESGDLYNALGFGYWRAGNYDKAIAAHRSYVQLAPNEANAHDSLGMTYIEVGRYEDSIAEFERALSLNPDFHFAKLHLGDVYFLSGRYNEASDQYRRFVELAPSDWDAATGYHRLVLLSLRKRDLSAATIAAQQELKCKNDMGGLFLVALAKDDLETADKSTEHFGNRSVIWIKNLHYFNGSLALKRGQMDEALGYFKEAVRLPRLLWNVDGVEDCLGDAYFEMGRFDEAIAEYQRLIAINPNYPLVHYHLAQTFEKKGDQDKARASYQRFLDIWKNADTDLAEVITAKQRLAS